MQCHGNEAGPNRFRYDMSACINMSHLACITQAGALSLETMMFELTLSPGDMTGVIVPLNLLTLFRELWPTAVWRCKASDVCVVGSAAGKEVDSGGTAPI